MVEMAVSNAIWKEGVDDLEDQKVKIYQSFPELITEIDDSEKLILVVVYNVYDDLIKMWDIFINKNTNPIFMSDFHVLALNAKSKDYFIDVELLGLEPFTQKSQSFIHNIFIARLEKCTINIVSSIDISNLSTAEIIYELYIVSQKYQEELCEQRYLAFNEYTKQLHLRWNLQHYTFDQAIDLTLNQKFPHLRKMLLLYIYRRESELCQRFNTFLYALQRYNKFLVSLVWEPSLEWNAYLVHLCNVNFGQECIRKCIESEEGGIFLMTPFEQNGKVEAKILNATTSLEQYQQLNVPIYTDSHLENFIKFNKITVQSEDEAITSFARMTIFEDKIIKDSLCNVIEKCLATPKMLFFFMGNPFSELWNNVSNKLQSITQHDTNELLVWDTTKTERNECLSIALKRAFNMDKLEVMLKTQLDALFVFVPIGSSMFLHTVIDKSTSIELKKAHNFFLAESALATNEYNNNGPIAYQQIMCEKMGDRDFDCFELEKKGQEDAFKNKIAFAYFGPPQKEDGSYNENQNKVITSATKFLRNFASEYGENENTLYISFMRVCLTPFPTEKLEKRQQDEEYDATFDFYILPLFGIRKCQNGTGRGGSCRQFVDHTGRIYNNWNNFLEDNRYPKALLIAPKNGRYRMNFKGNVELDIGPSPACGFGPALLKNLDIGTSVLGIAAGAAMIAGSFITMPFLPVFAFPTGLGVGLYGISRSVCYIVDRLKHGESMSLSESEARSAYLNIIAGSLGFTTAGATMVLTAFVQNGATIGLGVCAAIDGLTAVNVAANAVALGNSIYDYATNRPDDAMSNTLIIIQLTSSVLFFGHSVYSTESANSIIERSQMTKLGDFMDSLSSNRLRKHFNRLVQETVANTGSTQTGYAEVISYLNSVDNAQDVVRVLTRNQKMMGKNGVKYRVGNNKVLFNGVEMNINDFANMSKAQRLDVLSSLESVAPRQRSSTPYTSHWSSPQWHRIGGIMLQLSKPIFDIAMENGSIEDKVLKIVKVFSRFVQNELISIVDNFLENIATTELVRTLDDILPGCRTNISKLIYICLAYFQNKISADEGGEVTHNAIARCVINFKCQYEKNMQELEIYCSEWIVKCLVNMKLLEPPSIEINRSQKHCLECGGAFYSK